MVAQETAKGGYRLDYARMHTIGDIVRYHAEQRGNACAFKFGDRLTTYKDLDVRSNQVANGLNELKIKVGDRIAYLGKNNDYYFEVLMGSAKAGAVITPINFRLSTVEIAGIISDAGAKALFVDRDFVDVIKQMNPETLGVEFIAVMDDRSSSLTDYESWRDEQLCHDPCADVDAASIALQIYTSGTTGQPKGAMLSHQAIIGMRRCVALADLEWNRWVPEDVGLLAMPVGHIAGTGWGITSLYNGAKSVIAREFNPRDILDFVERERISKLLLVPAALQIVLRDPRARSTDYSRLKCIYYGASPMPLGLLRECLEVFGCRFAQQYGMTETCGTIFVLPPEDHTTADTARMRSAGKPLPGVEVEILDDRGVVVPTGEVGEITTRSIGNMSGYWNLPEATASVLSPDGWLRTGDAGYTDEDGYIYIHDRIKDMIISGGENIYPAEVENAIFDHPDVSEVAVIGIPDEKWGEAVKALVVPKPGRSPIAADIITWAEKRIARFKIPKSIDFIDELPRNPSGKILRRTLRERYWMGQGRGIN